MLFSVLLSVTCVCIKLMTNLFLDVHYTIHMIVLFSLFKHLVLINQMEGSMIPACLSLMRIFTGGVGGGAILAVLFLHKKMCLMYFFVLYLCQD